MRDVIAGLQRTPKTLPCKYFYDERGSALFDEICELDAYYPTRTELAIMERHAPALAQHLGPRARIVEFGSGSSVKTQLLLDALVDPVGYVPVDISREHLLATAERLRERYPQLDIQPVVADFTKSFEIPASPEHPASTWVYFPGSTIGNFEHDEARRLLARMASLAGRVGGIVVGVDLDKDRATLELAYDDPAGVTAAFNKNLLVRLRDELGARVDVDAFDHIARYDATRMRIEIFLESRTHQSIALAGHEFALAPGERILTEYSHKYTLPALTDLAAPAGLRLAAHWTDPDSLFAVACFDVDTATED